MTRGPAKRPSRLTELLGNPGHQKKNVNEPRPNTLADLTPPAYLDKDAKKEWKRVAKQLHELNMLTEVDTTALALYCTAWSDFLRLTTFLREHGETFATATGYVMPRPEVAMRRNAFTQVQKMCCEFGFTPGARAKMQVSVEPKKALTLDDILNEESEPIN